MKEGIQNHQILMEVNKYQDQELNMNDLITLFIFNLLSLSFLITKSKSTSSRILRR